MRLVVNLTAIPMAVPHTRPIGVTVHGTRPELTEGHEALFTTAEVPGSAVALVEYRLGEAGHAAMGFAVHVPHYLARAEYPQAARVLAGPPGGATGLYLPTEALSTAAERAEREIDEQVAGSEEVAQVVAALEQQYDMVAAGAASGRDVRWAGSCPAPTSPGQEVERFLAGHRRPDQGDTDRRDDPNYDGLLGRHATGTVAHDASTSSSRNGRIPSAPGCVDQSVTGGAGYCTTEPHRGGKACTPGPPTMTLHDTDDLSATRSPARTTYASLRACRRRRDRRRRRGAARRLGSSDARPSGLRGGGRDRPHRLGRARHDVAERGRDNRTRRGHHRRRLGVRAGRHRLRGVRAVAGVQPLRQDPARPRRRGAGVPTASWIAMMFSAGMGIGLMFYGVAEPLSHFYLPPPGTVAADTPEALDVAMATTLFHWTLHPWAIYAVVGLAIAYSTFRRGRRS